MKNKRKTKPLKPKRIIFAANCCAGLYLLRLGPMTALRDAGLEVICVAAKDEYATKLIADGFRVEFVKLSGHSRKLYGEYYTFKNLKQVYSKLKPDLIFHYTIKLNLYGTFAANSLSIPCISIIPGLGIAPELSNKFIKSAINFMYKRAMKLVQEVWFVNAHDHGFFEGRDWLDGVQTRILPSEGIDLKRFSYSEPPISRNRIKALYASRLIKSKGVHELIKAAKICGDQNDPISVQIVGFLEDENPDAISLTSLEKALADGYIEYLGETIDARPLIRDADIIVLPTKYREGVPQILLESLSIGRPILVTENVGCTELVDHGENGFIVPKDNPLAIAQALSYFANLSRAERIKMGEKAREMVEKYYDERFVISEYFKILGIPQNVKPFAKRKSTRQRTSRF